MARDLAHHARILTAAWLPSVAPTPFRASRSPPPLSWYGKTFRGLRRAYGRPQRRVKALTAEKLGAIISSLSQSAKDVRDRALLLVGFAGAFRRSELIAIDVAAVEWVADGIVVALYRSKTDQEWWGRKIGIRRAPGAMCPVAALSGWIALSGITDGPVFRPVTKGDQILAGRLSGDSIAAIVKQHVAAIGLDPSLYSGHSLRAGFATSAAAAGLPMWKIKAQTGHVSDAVLNRYIRIADPLIA